MPVDGIPMRADVDPSTFVRVLAYLVNHRPTILHTHLVHADAYGQTAGTIAGVPVRLSTKHGFNEFREGRHLRARRPDDRRARAPADRDLARARPLPRGDRGLRRAGLRDRPLRDRRRARAGAVRRRGAAVPLHRAPDPDQGPRRAAARVPAGARRAARPEARHRRPRRARARAEGSLPRARAERRRALPRPRDADPAGGRGLAGGRRSVARRGLRDGRARGDGAGAAGDRRGDRRARGPRPRRRDGPARRRRATPTSLAEAMLALAADPARAAAMGLGRAAARSSASPSSAAPSGPKRSTATGSRCAADGALELVPSGPAARLRERRPR